MLGFIGLIGFVELIEFVELIGLWEVSFRFQYRVFLNCLDKREVEAVKIELIYSRLLSINSHKIHITLLERS